MVKYLSFHNSSSFALRYFFNVNGKAIVRVTRPLIINTRLILCKMYKGIRKKKGELKGHQAIHLMNMSDH
jgi:hypothetical protein